MAPCYGLPRKLTYSATSCVDACASTNKSSYYSDYADFQIGGTIYEDSFCSISAKAGYYSDNYDGGSTCYQVNGLGVITFTSDCSNTITKFQDCNDVTNVFRFSAPSLPTTLGNTYYISGAGFFEGCATIVTDDGGGDLYDGTSVIFTLASDCDDPICPKCGYSSFCFTTTLPSLSGYAGNYTTNYSIYNSTLYYTGDGTTYGVIYYTGDYWCLSDSLGGTPILQGKSPCDSDCPDIIGNNFSTGLCPTPTPSPVNCDTFSFDAIFDCLYTPPVTPSQPVDCADVEFDFTNFVIPPTPSASPNYNVGLNFSIYHSSPTPTPSVTVTPTASSNYISFNGKATFLILDPPYTCPSVNVLVNCKTNEEYYVPELVIFNNTQVGLGTVMFVQLSTVNGVIGVCVTFDRVSLNLTSNSNLNQIYQIFVDCPKCLNEPTPTPTNTQTPTITPTNTQTPTNTSTNTPTPSITPTNTQTPTTTPTETPTNTPTPTVTPSQTPLADCSLSGYTFAII